MSLRRRDFLDRAGQAGGHGAIDLFMQSLWAIAYPRSRFRIRFLRPVDGYGTRVLIHSASIAGLCLAQFAEGIGALLDQEFPAQGLLRFT